jgi:putative flavoprotein involved in K+ transport
VERIETVIVGGGQAGLATSYYLTEQGHAHVVLEQAARAAPVWRDERWDSFTLVTPNWTLRMPGAEYDGPDRGGFMPRDEVVAYFERYVDQFRLPVQYSARVLAIEPMDEGGFRVITPERNFAARNVVVATGYEQSPHIPPFASAIPPGITQLHSSRYRNPEALPPGAVLVVGSAQSGAQIAEELYQHGRRVFLSVGNAGRAPRRYRGKDVTEWLLPIGFFDMTPDKLPMPKEQFAPPHVSGVDGGHTLNLHQFARDGVTLLGHVRGASGDTLSLAPDLHETLARVDGFEAEFQKMIDGYIQANGIDAPVEELPRLRDGYDQPLRKTLNLREAGITTIIWATGYRYDYGLVKAPVFDGGGFPVQTRGVTRQAGLFFVGMPWMPSLKTGVLPGVGEAAEHIASHILRRAGSAAADRRDERMPARGTPAVSAGVT